MDIIVTILIQKNQFFRFAIAVISIYHALNASLNQKKAIAGVQNSYLKSLKVGRKKHHQDKQSYLGQLGKLIIQKLKR